MGERPYFTCVKCGLKTPIEKPYAYIQAHKNQPLYNYLELYCPCGCMWRVFGTAEILSILKERGNLEVRWRSHATEEVIRAFAQVYFSQNLNEKDQELVDFFHSLLEKTHTIEDIVEWR
jgi:hypothetical protein